MVHAAWRVACVEGGHAAVSHSPCWPQNLLTCSLTAHLLTQAAIFLHEELGGAQAMGGALIVAANLLA